MTVCAVRVLGKVIIMGADGLGSNNYDILSEHRRKLHHLHEGKSRELIYAAAGSSYLTTAFHRHILDRTRAITDWDWSSKEGYINDLNEFVEDFIKGYVPNYKEESLSCLIAPKEFMCCHLIHHNDIREICYGDYAAIGVGDDVALGALYAGGTVLEAISAACKHKLHCGGDIQVDALRSK